MALLMAGSAFAGTTKNCTLSPVEQTQVDEYYGSSFEKAIALKVNLSQGKQSLSIDLAPRSSIMNGVNQVVTYDLKTVASGAGVIQIIMDNNGVDMVTNFGHSSSAWNKGKIHNQSVMYKLPNNRLAVAVLVCQ